MPTLYCEAYASRVARREAIEAHVRKKFPHLLKGSSGWYRACAARKK